MHMQCRTILWYYRLICTSILWGCVTGWPGGAPPTSCQTLNPFGHMQGGVNSQLFPSPYEITTSSNTYIPLQQIEVTISTVCGQTFKGFLVEARPANPSATVNSGFGNFTSTDNNSRILCSNDYGISHTDRSLKSNITFIWTAPSSPVGHVVFQATIVENFAVFWLGAKSNMVKDASLSDSPSYQGVPSPTTASNSCVTEPPPGNRFLRPSACGVSAGCFDDCDDTGCSYVITWQDQVDDVQFSIKSNFPGTGNAYMAIGLSSDQRMGNDAVMECVYFNGRMAVYNSKNTGTTNQRYTTSAAHKEEGTYIDGVFECLFWQSKNNTPDNSLFDLNRNHYLLFARGTTVTATNIGRHTVQPLATFEEVNLQTFTVTTENELKVTLVKLHGALMVLAWILASSVGIIIARYYKPTWSEKKVLGQKLWFQIHRGLMTIVVLSTVVSFIVIFVDVNGFSEMQGEMYRSAHPVLGIIVTVLAVTNPIMAAFRPHPDAEKRPIFNWAHSIVGTTAFILAVANVILGLNMGKPAVPNYLMWVVVAHAGWQVVFEIALTIYKLLTGSGDTDNFDPVFEMSQAGYSVNITKITQQNTTVKNIALIAHVVVSGAVALTVVIVIGIS